MPVAQMTVANALVAIRSSTAHDADTQVTDTQLTAKLDKEYRRVRRWLEMIVPSLYQKELDNIAITSGNNTIAKPDDYERVVTLERQANQGVYVPLSMRPQLHAHAGRQLDASGLYRLTYVARPIDGYTTLDVPEGAEDIIIEHVAAWVRQRHNEDYAYHLQEANRIQDELRTSLKMRYGAHPRCVLQTTPSTWQFLSFFEEGTNLVVA